MRQESDGFPHGLGTVSGRAALETDIVLVVHVLERPEIRTCNHPSRRPLQASVCGHGWRCGRAGGTRCRLMSARRSRRSPRTCARNHPSPSRPCCRNRVRSQRRRQPDGDRRPPFCSMAQESRSCRAQGRTLRGRGAARRGSCGCPGCGVCQEDLAVESQDHSNFHRAEFTCSGHDLAHRFVERRLDRRVFGQDEAVNPAQLAETSMSRPLRALRISLARAGRFRPFGSKPRTSRSSMKSSCSPRFFPGANPFLKRELQLKTVARTSSCPMQWHIPAA